MAPLSGSPRALTRISPAGVDLELWAHEHTYERLWPVYGDKVGSRLGARPLGSNASLRPLCFASQVCNGSAEQPYVDPRAPVHIITGSAVSTPVGAVSFVPPGERGL